MSHLLDMFRMFEHPETLAGVDTPESGCPVPASADTERKSQLDAGHSVEVAQQGPDQDSRVKVPHLGGGGTMQKKTIKVKIKEKPSVFYHMILRRVFFGQPICS